MYYLHFSSTHVITLCSNLSKGVARVGSMAEVLGIAGTRALNRTGQGGASVEVRMRGGSPLIPRSGS
jgi:hypothetical protein